jgi:hypothetical protein
MVVDWVWDHLMHIFECEVVVMRRDLCNVLRC